MFGVQAEHRAGLGWFRRLLTERADPAHRGQINLKYAGTLPLAEAIRLLALRGGIAATGTLARIDALGRAGELSRDDAGLPARRLRPHHGPAAADLIADFRPGGRSPTSSTRRT